MTTNSTRIPFPPPATPVVTDAGLETWLIFERGVDLPAFAAYPLAATKDGQALLTEYYEQFLAIARDAGAAVVLEAPTWRANPDWAATLGHDRETLARMIDASVDVVHRLRSRWTGEQPFLVGAAVGPRGDGYRIDAIPTEHGVPSVGYALVEIVDSTRGMRPIHISVWYPSTDSDSANGMSLADYSRTIAVEGTANRVTPRLAAAGDSRARRRSRGRSSSRAGS